MNKPVIVATLDFNNAFVEVSHRYINTIFEKVHLNTDSRKIIEDMYSGSSTRIITSGDCTNEIIIRNGTRQYCPLSPLLFNLCLNPLLESIENQCGGCGYTFSGTE